jgi:hypothetical protein
MAVMDDPAYRQFVQQRVMARRRSIEWRLEYWEWRQIWDDSGHFHERGTCGGQWVMGRNGDIGPYAAGNVKIIRCETNNSFAQISKRNKRLANEQRGTA